MKVNLLHSLPCHWAQSIFHSEKFEAHLAQTVKHLPTTRETWVQSLGREDPPEKEMATHSSTLAWKIPWREEPGRLQSMGSQSQTWLRDFTYTWLGRVEDYDPLWACTCIRVTFCVSEDCLTEPGPGWGKLRNIPTSLAGNGTHRTTALPSPPMESTTFSPPGKSSGTRTELSGPPNVDTLRTNFILHIPGNQQKANFLDQITHSDLTFISSSLSANFLTFHASKHFHGSSKIPYLWPPNLPQLWISLYFFYLTISKFEHSFLFVFFSFKPASTSEGLSIFILCVPWGQEVGMCVLDPFSYL